MLNVARTIVKEGYWKMKDAFRCLAEHEQPCSICPKKIQDSSALSGKPVQRAESVSMANYTSAHAKRKFLQMPVAALSVTTGQRELAIFLVEKHSNYIMFQSLLGQIHNQHDQHTGTLSREAFKALIQLCESDPERTRMRYAVAASSGLSQGKLDKAYGISGVKQRKIKVENALSRAQEIRECVHRLSSIRERAVLQSVGIKTDFLDVDSSSDCQTESETDSDSEEGDSLYPLHCKPDKIERIPERQTNQQGQTEKINLSFDQLLEILKEKKWNWISFVEVLKLKFTGETQEEFDQTLIDFSTKLKVVGLNDEEQKLVEQSKEAYLLTNEEELSDKDQIVSELEDDHPEEWVGIQDPLQGTGKDMVIRKIKAARRKVKRNCARKIAEERLLSRRRSKRVGTILRNYPDIGKQIEAYVKECGVGAEAWRRTGVLTFDGNRKVAQKVTFVRIQKHLEKIYNRKFGYGTVVQLCVARNRRRRSALNYKGVAQVTSRRARKGFSIRYNPDSHWSSALYRGLDAIEYHDGTNKLNLNRDDMSVFRLDSMATNNKAPTLCIKGSPVLTTKTDFQASYPNTIQTSSYNFTASKNTGELCAGVVKAIPLHCKNPAQHMADIEMLEREEELQPAFFCGDTPKEIECIRTDSGYDEAPHYEEVQFWWTKRHLEKPTSVLLLSSRHSGGSNLNRVELQNGCEAKARSGLFIPSTLNGSNLNKAGKLDNERLCQNLSDAIEVYISRVQGAPCGDTSIHYFKGPDSAELQTLRGNVLKFLRGSKAEKKALQQNHPSDYDLISKVLDVRRRHINKAVPSRYVFQLVCCYQQGCPHPLCQKGHANGTVPTWYEGGPLVTYIPLPAPDPKRPVGGKSCSQCKGDCCGHYRPAADVIQDHLAGKEVNVNLKPPSEILKDYHKKHGNSADEDVLHELALKTVLPASEVKLWLDHLQEIKEHRQEGARNAAETRRSKQNQSNSGAKKKGKKTEVDDDEVCQVCFADEPPGTTAPDGGDHDIAWIGCDKCHHWFHKECLSVDIEEKDLLQWFCSFCVL